MVLLFGNLRPAILEQGLVAALREEFELRKASLSVPERRERPARGGPGELHRFRRYAVVLAFIAAIVAVQRFRRRAKNTPSRSAWPPRRTG